MVQGKVERNKKRWGEPGIGNSCARSNSQTLKKYLFPIVSGLGGLQAGEDVRIAERGREKVSVFSIS